MSDTTRYLFRGKRVKNGEWVEGYYAKSPFVGRLIDDNIVQHAALILSFKFDMKRYSGGGLCDCCTWCEVIPETVGMYTGLTDKNGAQIFEGDILVEDGHHFVVQWDDTWAKYRLRHNRRVYQYPEWNRGVKMVHVGNIHDNPELMED